MALATVPYKGTCHESHVFGTFRMKHKLGKLAFIDLKLDISF
jgi:hypothetical protein